MSDDPPDVATARARLQGKRVGLGVVIVAAVAFILATAVHVIPAVFGARIVPIEPGICADGLRELGAALDRGDPWPRERVEQREVVADVCAVTSGGLDAWASFERLRLAGQQLGGRDPAALARLKRDLAAHLPADLR